MDTKRRAGAPAKEEAASGSEGVDALGALGVLCFLSLGYQRRAPASLLSRRRARRRAASPPGPSPPLGLPNVNLGPKSCAIVG